MAKRKTISVEKIRNMVNVKLQDRTDTPEARAARMAVADLLDIILHETGNYQGFNYLGWMTNAPGSDDGYTRWMHAGRPRDEFRGIPAEFRGDETRRYYY